jgi:hypothetical protein
VLSSTSSTTPRRVDTDQTGVIQRLLKVEKVEHSGNIRNCILQLGTIHALHAVDMHILAKYWPLTDTDAHNHSVMNIFFTQIRHSRLVHELIDVTQELITECSECI